MIRNVTLRRLILSFGLFIALLTHFQVVFACELKDDETPLVCCCEAISESSMGCDMGNGGGCNTLAAKMTSSEPNCCNTSYQYAPGATVVAPDAHTQQGLVLHSSQPLPLTTTFVITDFYQPIQILRFISSLPPGPASKQTYRLTNRLRI